MVAPPLGPAAAPLRLAVSYTESPIATVSDEPAVALVLAVESCKLVDSAGEFRPTTRISLQGLVVPLLLLSPEYTACHEYVPAFMNTTVFEFGITLVLPAPVVKLFALGVSFTAVPEQLLPE